MQTVTLEGYLSADPVLRTSENGRRRATFRIVETTRFRTASGERGERTTGFNCVCFSDATAARYIAPYARKGSRVVVHGHVENDAWTGKDGVEHRDLRMIVADLRIKNRARPDDPPGPAAED